MSDGIKYAVILGGVAAATFLVYKMIPKSEDVKKAAKEGLEALEQGAQYIYEGAKEAAKQTEKAVEQAADYSYQKVIDTGVYINSIAQNLFYSEIERKGIVGSTINFSFSVDSKLAELKNKNADEFNAKVRNIRLTKNTYLYNVVYVSPKGIMYYISSNILDDFDKSTFAENKLNVEMRYEALDFWSLCKADKKITGIEGLYTKDDCSKLRDELRTIFKGLNVNTKEEISEAFNRMFDLIKKQQIGAIDIYFTQLGKDNHKSFFLMPVGLPSFDNDFNVMMAKIIRLKSMVDRKEDKFIKVATYNKDAISDDYNVEENIQFILKNSELDIKGSLKADLDSITKDIFKLYGLNIT